MKRYIIVAGIMAAALMASGCGDLVRDELITMQNEIDLLYTQVDQMNKGLSTLHGIVNEMASNGYIVDVKEFKNEDEKGGYTLAFRTVRLDENSGIISEDTYSIDLYSGVDGKDGKDAEPFVVSARKDTTDNRWYWYDVQGEEWMVSEEGERFLVDGKDGKTPHLKVENGYWLYSMDGDDVPDAEKEWHETQWKAKGEDAKEIFSGANVLDDRIELTLASDSTVLTLLRYLPVDVKLTAGGSELKDSLTIAPGETIPISYTLSGTGAADAILVAGTDGRFKTSITRNSATEGTVDVTCPATFPEGGYIYITINDGNGRSTVKVIHFVQRVFTILYGETVHSVAADGENGVSLTFETNSSLDARCTFPAGVEPWISIGFKTVNEVSSLTYDVKANTSANPRSATIIVTPKDNPGFEIARITVNQAGKV
ncbi:MAG: hypothetical protein IJK73_03675 [Bacteroidales bacterium]|nr:hypothetical protein [Bacteroidales bacterium]